MPHSRSRARNGVAALGLLIGSIQTAEADMPSWFGPACTGDAVTVVPMGIQEILVSVHTTPKDPGEPDTLLQTTDGDLWIAPQSLQRWHAPVPQESMTRDDARWVPLRAVAGLRYRFDPCTQNLWVDAAGVNRPATRFDLNSEVTARPGQATIVPGGYFNLDTQLSRFQSSTRASGLGELGLFNAQGYGSTSFVLDTEHSVRLDTSWNMDDPESLHRLTLGDAISRSSNFGQSVRFGGLQWGRQFSLRPDIITYPLPTFRGSAALASSVDVYVNQSLRTNQDVPAGPFELNRVPVVAGQGEVQLVVRDVLGREQVVSYPFYAAPVLLREDLTDYTVEAGWLRNNYTQSSADYGRFLASSTYRKGITDTFTAETHAEILHEQELLSISGAWLQPMLGVFSAGVAGSGTANGLGSSAQLGFERVSRQWSFAAELRRSSSGFVRAGDANNNNVRQSELVRLGFVPHPAGSLSLSYVHQRRQDNDDVSLLGMTYSYGFARDWTLSATATEARSNSRDYSVYVGLNWQFARNFLASSEITHDNSGTRERFSVQRNVEGALDYSWRASAETGANARYDVHGQWERERGTVTADVEQLSGNLGSRLGYTTGFVWLGSDIFWTRPVDGSFAVVDTQGVPDVRIYRDERLAGRTNQQGKLLVPDLRTYETTTLRIEDSDVPIEYEIPDLHQPIFLPTRGGARALFSVKSLDTFVIFKLHLPDGRPVPAGAQVKASGSGENLPVGFDGQVYLSATSKINQLEARWPGHRCVAQWSAGSSETINALCEEVP